MDCRVDIGGEVKILVYSMSGQEVEKLVDQQMSPGNYRFYWDGHNVSGNIVGNGLYFIVSVQPSGRMSQKVIILK